SRAPAACPVPCSTVVNRLLLDRPHRAKIYPDTTVTRKPIRPEARPTSMRLAIALVAAVLTAGCASATATVGHPVPVASLSQATNADRQASAQGDAASHLAAFVPPTGAHQLHGRPAGADALATDPGMSSRTTARATSWWEVTSSVAPADMVAAVKVPA